SHTPQSLRSCHGCAGLYRAPADGAPFAGKERAVTGQTASDTAVPDAPRRGLLRLRFPAELEAEFRASQRDGQRRWARMSLLLALSTVLGFAVIDHWVLPNAGIGHSDLV